MINLNNAGWIVYVSNTVDDMPINVVSPTEFMAG